jgi:hypothetical protein
MTSRGSSTACSNHPAAQRPKTYKVRKLLPVVTMHPRRHIPLYPQPPSPIQTQDALPSDELSDFPPIRVHETTPESSPIRSVASHSRPSDELSDFPPIRVHETTPESSPESPIRSVASYSRLRSLGIHQKVHKAATSKLFLPLFFSSPKRFRTRVA